MAVEVLPPILATLSRRHPNLIIELSPSNRNEDVLRREADVAVRMVLPQQEALIAQRIARPEEIPEAALAAVTAAVVEKPSSVFNAAVSGLVTFTGTARRVPVGL